MKEKIVAYCKQLEKSEGIRILFAVENGSRAWRMESEDSDFDVRFVYIRPLKDYLGLKDKSDVITAAWNKSGEPCPVEGSFIDMSGFDLFKFLRLLATSNPTTLEWLTTDIVYYGEQNTIFKQFAQQNANPLALFHHYKSLCHQNYAKYIKTGQLVTYKKYLYAYRGLVNTTWVLHKKTIPPIIFTEAVEGVSDHLPTTIVERLREIIRLKSSGQEKDKISNLPDMDNYIESFLKSKEQPEAVKTASWTVLEAEAQRIILG